MLGVDFQDLGNDQESYRWNYLQENNQAADQWGQMMAFAKMMSLTGTNIDAPSQRLMDVNEWCRAFAFESLDDALRQPGRAELERCAGLHRCAQQLRVEPAPDGDGLRDHEQRRK